MKRLLSQIVLGSLLTALTLTSIGCVGMNYGNRQKREATSLADYLYPGDTEHIAQPAIPVLSLPLNVGIAFVPEFYKNSKGGTTRTYQSRLDENRRIQLMQNVSSHFQAQPFVKRIELIPSSYLTPQGSFENLDQLKRLFNVDVIALVSYDQAQFSDETAWSFTYWTIVGAYVVPGERNDTRTLLDCAVYDIASRQLLFRAPGVSTVKGNATPINANEELRRDSEQGFDIAATNLVTNLEVELGRFKDRVKRSPDEIRVVNKPGYTGAGALDGMTVLLFAALVTLGMRATAPRRA